MNLFRASRVYFTLGDFEGPMLQSLTDDFLSEQLLRIAREPDLRNRIYERLGEYCHQCRNRLNSLKLSLYLVIRQAPASTLARWQQIECHYEELERRVDQIQTLCRPLALSRVTLGLDLLIEDRRSSWNDRMDRAGKTLKFQPPVSRVVASFDVDRLGQALDEFVAWRAEESESGGSASFRWWAESGRVHIVWEESGASGNSTKSSSTSTDAAWSLPLLARIVLAHLGDFRVDHDHGFRLELSWPTAIPS